MANKPKSTETGATLHKAALGERIAARTGLPKNQVAKLLDALVTEVTEAVSHGQTRVHIPHLGTFEPIERRPRTGRNPQTGAKIDIPARRTVRFRPAGALHQLLSG